MSGRWHVVGGKWGIRNRCQGLGDKGLAAALGYARAQDGSLERPTRPGSTVQLQIPAQLLWTLERGGPLPSWHELHWA